MPKKEAPFLLTARLVLRPRQEKDVPQMLDLFRNEEVHQYLGGYPPTEERAMQRNTMRITSFRRRNIWKREKIV